MQATWRRITLVWWVTLLGLSSAASARAQDTCGDAATLVNRGGADEASLRAACDVLEACYRERPQVKNKAKVAVCHLTLGLGRTAYRDLDQVKAMAEGAGGPDAEDIKGLYRDINARGPFLRLDLPAGFTPKSVTIDGQPSPPEEWGRPILVDAGDHAVVITTELSLAYTYKLKVEKSGVRQLKPALHAANLDVPTLFQASDRSVTLDGIPIDGAALRGKVFLPEGEHTLAAGGTELAFTVKREASDIVVLGKRTPMGGACAADGECSTNVCYEGRCTLYACDDAFKHVNDEGECVNTYAAQVFFGIGVAGIVAGVVGLGIYSGGSVARLTGQDTSGEKSTQRAGWITAVAGFSGGAALMITGFVIGGVAKFPSAPEATVSLVPAAPGADLAGATLSVVF